MSGKYEFASLVAVSLESKAAVSASSPGFIGIIELLIPIIIDLIENCDDNDASGIQRMATEDSRRSKLLVGLGIRRKAGRRIWKEVGKWECANTFVELASDPDHLELMASVLKGE